MKPICLTAVILSILLMISCKNNRKIYDEIGSMPIANYTNTVFTSTIENKIPDSNANVLYTTTLLYAWDELRNMLDGAIEVQSSDIELTNINNSNSYKNTLDTSEYVNQITEDDETIHIRSSFKIKLPFKYDMHETELQFDSIKVSAFGMNYYDYDVANEIGILYYKNDDCFIIKLFPKTEGHAIYIAKGFNNHNTLSDIIADIKKHIEIAKQEYSNPKLSWKYELSDEDVVSIPETKFDINNSYTNIAGSKVNANKQDYIIADVKQRIALELTKNGAKIESEAEVEAVAAAMEEPMPEEEKPKPKHLVFDKPYTLYMKSNKARFPYFIMKVQNTSLMKKI